MKKYISPEFEALELEKKKVLVELLLWSDNDIPVDEDEEETESAQ